MSHSWPLFLVLRPVFAVAFVSFAVEPMTLPQRAFVQEPARVEGARVVRPLVFEGFVNTPEGAPAEGAVVVTSAGGKAVVDWRGFFHLKTQVQHESDRVQVTAVSSGGRSHVASTTVILPAGGGHLLVETLTRASGWCQPTAAVTTAWGRAAGTRGPRREEDEAVWYNEHRPHTGLGGRTPAEIMEGIRPAIDRPRFEPRRLLPRRGVRLRGGPGARLDVVLKGVGGRRHLPVVELRKAA